MQPGVLRSFSMGILGFTVGMALVVVVRVMQAIDPAWDSLTVFSLSIITGILFAIWGGDSKADWPGGASDESQADNLSIDMSRTSFTRIFESIARFLLNQEPMPEAGKPPFNPDFFLFRWIINIIWFFWVFMAQALRALSLVPYPEWTNLTKPPVKFVFFINWVWYPIWFVISFGWLLLGRVVGLALAIPMIVLGGLIDGIVNLFRVLVMQRSALWLMTLSSVLVILVVFLSALAPTGFFVPVTDDPGASVIGNGIGTVNYPNLKKVVSEVAPPLGDLEIFDGERQIRINTEEPAQISQFTMFAIFVVITLVSIAVVAALLALAVYGLNYQLTDVRTNDPTEADLTPPEIVQDMGGLGGFMVRVFRGIPSFLGIK